MNERRVLAPLGLSALVAAGCLLGAQDHRDHVPEPGSYRPAPPQVFSISGNYGGTAIALGRAVSNLPEF